MCECVDYYVDVYCVCDGGVGFEELFVVGFLFLVVVDVGVVGGENDEVIVFVEVVL